MLQSPPLSKVYGHGNIKKFWLMQNQIESEAKALGASSPLRHGSSSAGLGHESKQGPQFSLGNVTPMSLSSPSGVSVRSLGTGPGCFNLALARHASLVTCAESLSPPLRTDQPRSLLRPLSPRMSKEDDSLAEDDDHHVLTKSPCRGSASTSLCDSPLTLGNHLDEDVLCNYPPTSKDVFDSSIHDHFYLSKDHQQDDAHLQERVDHVETPYDAVCKGLIRDSQGCTLEVFSNLDSRTPFSVPFRLPEKYFVEAEGPGNGYPERNLQGKNGPTLTSSFLDCGPAKSELIESSHFNICKASKEAHPVGASGLRTCSVCGTSKTPLWRSGPQGPKSLCNACGIRFKKAKRSSGEVSVTPLPSPQSMKNLLKPAKRKQDTLPVNSEAHIVRPLVIGSPMSGVASQVAKKRRWSKLIKKGESVAPKREGTGSSGESTLTWSLHSPTAVSSPNVTQFERLSIDENAAASYMVAGKDEEEAAMLLMYMSCGLVFA